MLGIIGINTREAPYLVFINTLKKLNTTQLDAAIGLTSIALLSAIRVFCAKMEAKQTSRKRMWAAISSLRLTFTIILYTVVSYLVHQSTPLSEAKFRIVGVIEPGKQKGYGGDYE